MQRAIRSVMTEAVAGRTDDLHSTRVGWRATGLQPDGRKLRKAVPETLHVPDEEDHIRGDLHFLVPIFGILLVLVPVTGLTAVITLRYGASRSSRLARSPPTASGSSRRDRRAAQDAPGGHHPRGLRVFANWYSREPIRWNIVVGFALIAAGAGFVFAPWGRIFPEAESAPLSAPAVDVHTASCNGPECVDRHGGRH